MNRSQALWLLTALVSTTMVVGACSNKPLGGNGGAGGAGSGGGAGGRAGNAGLDGGAGIVACDDGTAATDCCADPATTGACASEGLTCWTRCAFSSSTASEGLRSQKFCGGGQWSSGHGVFPCSRATSDGGRPGLVACDDGTGATDCCADPATSGACANPGLMCFTTCGFISAAWIDGYRGVKFCNSQWSQGKGEYPCHRPASDGGSSDGSSPLCAIGADQTCNDDPMVSSLWGQCQTNGACACYPGRSINPATGRCRLDPAP